MGEGDGAQPGATSKQLTARQEAFCRHYVVHLNASKAAREAGYSHDTAYSMGSENLSKPEIRDRVHHLMEQRMHRVGIDADAVLRRLDDISDFDPAVILDENGHIRPMADIPPWARKAIKKVKYRAEWMGAGVNKEKVAEIVEIEFWDKVKASELLGKHKKLFNEEVEVKHTHTLEHIVAGSAEKDVTPKALPAKEGDKQE